MKKLLWVTILLIIVTACNLTGRVVEEPDECNVLKGQTTIDNCYFEKAISTADNTFCEKITMEPLRESCISEIGIATNNLEICENLSENAKGNCYSKIAINRQNETMCPFIESEYWFDICHYELGIIQNKPELCYEMWDIDRADECYDKIAEATLDETICSWTTMVKAENFCYKKLAIMKKNASICNEIWDLMWREGNCIKKVAKETNDASICEMIGLVEIKEDCLEKFEN